MLTSLYSSRLTRKESGFTLLELLIVVIVIGILAAIALPIFINQQRVAVDASVKSDVRNTVTNVAGWRVAHQNVAVANTNEYTSAANGGKVAKSSDKSVIGVKIEASGRYTVCGFNDGGSKYQKAEQAWSFDSASGQFVQKFGASAKCEGAVAADGSDLSTTPVAPEWTTAETLPEGEKGGYYEQNLVATGNPDPKYTLASGQNVPAGMTMTQAGVLSGIPTVNGDFTFKVEAKNVKDTATREFKLHLDNTNVVPIWETPQTLIDATEGSPYSAFVSAPAYPVPTYDLKTGSTLPTGLQLNRTTGEITGTPSVNGSKIFTVVATNKKGAPERTFFLNIAPLTTPPVFSTTSIPNGQVGETYSGNVAATGKPNPTFTSITGLPGVTVSASGVLSGTPTTAGTFDNVVITASNANSDVTKKFSGVVITPAATISITTASLPQAYTNVSYDSGVIATTTANTNSGTVFEITGLPGGLGYSTSTGRITGTATNTFSGNLSVKATNGKASQTKSIPLSIIGSVTASISTPNGNVTLNPVLGTPYSYTIVAAGTPAPTVTVTGLPIWASYDAATKTISGTPTAAGATAGIVIKADNGVGTAATRTISINVQAQNLFTVTQASGFGNSVPGFANATYDAGNSRYRLDAANTTSWTYNGGYTVGSKYRYTAYVYTCSANAYLQVNTTNGTAGGTNCGYSTYSIDFTATSTSHAITFRSLGVTGAANGYYGLLQAMSLTRIG